MKDWKVRVLNPERVVVPRSVESYIRNRGLFVSRNMCPDQPENQCAVQIFTLEGLLFPPLNPQYYPSRKR